MGHDMRLTIAVPTYNRNVLLKKTLQHLLPQINGHCKLLIVDNCSDIPVASTLQEDLNKYQHINYKIARNVVNIGGGSNLLRCLELCETDWIWLLGDDDIPSDNAIENLLSIIKNYPDLIYASLCSNFHKRSKTTLTKGLDDFVMNIDNWGHINFTSISLFQRNKLISFIKYGYISLNSWSPLIALVLCALRNDSQCLFSDKEIIVGTTQASSADMWDPTAAMIGLTSLLELPMNLSPMKTLSKKICQKPSHEFLAAYLVKSALLGKNKEILLYKYDQICYRLYYFDKKLLRKVKIKAYRILLKYPLIGKTIISLLMRINKSHKLDFSSIVIADYTKRL